MKSPFTLHRDQLDGVIAFLRVAERRSFRAAAGDLGVSPSAVSQTIRNLERRVGAPLLTRTTRQVGLTEAGRRFLERAQPAVEELLGAFETAQTLGGRPAGLLRLNVPRAVIPYVIEPILAEFCAAYPDVQVEVCAEDRIADIIEQGFDAGVRLGELLHADMVAVPLTSSFQYAVVGAPAYFEGRSRPRRPEDLSGHACIGFRHVAAGPVYRWEFVDRGRAFEVTVAGQVIVNDTGLNLRAAVQGLGLAYTALPLAETHIASGALESVLSAYCPQSPGLFLYYPSRAQALPKLRAFVDFLRRRLPAAQAARKTAVTRPRPRARAAGS